MSHKLTTSSGRVVKPGRRISWEAMEPVVSVPDKKKNKGGGTRSGLQTLCNAVSSVPGVDTTSAVLQGVGAGAHTDDLGEGSTLREEVGEGLGSNPEHYQRRAVVLRLRVSIGNPRP